MQPTGQIRSPRLLRRVATVISVILLATACGSTRDDSGGTSAPPDEPPPLDATLIAQGQPLYEAYCASCHGVNGEGAADWRIPNSDGSYQPPPQDATGHTWHHSDQLLVDLIANGSSFAQSRMPAFGDRLSDAEIAAILEYIKAWWGPEESAFQWEVTQREP